MTNLINRIKTTYYKHIFYSAEADATWAFWMIVTITQTLHTMGF